MATVQDVLAALERIAPAQYAWSEDRIGLQVGSTAKKVAKVVTSLDRSLAAARFAREQGADVLLSHHPLIWAPMAKVLESDHAGQTVTELIRGEVAFIAAHTNWDAAPGGVNDTLAERLGLRNVVPFGSSSRVKRLQLVTFVPDEALQPLIDALTEAGAGVIGLYRRCAFYNPGTGTFLPLEGADPAVGSVGQVEEAQEVRLEMVVPESKAESVSQALRKAHPYEEPAFHLHVLWSPMEQPIGRVGELSDPVGAEDFTRFLDERLVTRSMVWGKPKSIRKVAVVGGAAADEWRSARSAGADVLVTGEVPQHVALEVSEMGFRIAAAGHFATENPGARRLGERLGQEIEGLEILHFEPAAGESGRPY